MLGTKECDSRIPGHSESRNTLPQRLELDEKIAKTKKLLANR